MKFWQGAQIVFLQQGARISGKRVAQSADDKLPVFATKGSDRIAGLFAQVRYVFVPALILPPAITKPPSKRQDQQRSGAQRVDVIRTFGLFLVLVFQAARE